MGEGRSLLHLFLAAIVIVLGIFVAIWLVNACQEEDAEDGEVGLPAAALHVAA